MDSLLVERIKRGDRKAMNDLYRQYIGVLASVCYRYVKDDDDAKDVLQDSFVRIFTSLDRFTGRGEGSLKAWMCRIVANRAVTFLKQRNRIATDTLGDKASEDYPDDTPDAGMVSSDELHEIVRSLPEGYRTVLNLYVFEEYSHKEIGNMLGISESTSASQLHHAKKMLARLIKERVRKRK